MFGLVTRPKPPTQVATRHIPYIEPLWERLQAARADLATREEYVRTVARMGTRIHATAELADRTITDGKRIAGAVKALERIKQALALGCEPTTPPQEWYCGHLTTPKDVYNRDRDRDEPPRETWPSRNRSDTASVFTSAIPVEALRRYAAVEPLLDDTRVYSPKWEDFLRLPEPIVHDPVIIGVITFLSEGVFLEVARWNVDQDLAVIFGRPK